MIKNIGRIGIGFVLGVETTIIAATIGAVIIAHDLHEETKSRNQIRYHSYHDHE